MQILKRVRSAVLYPVLGIAIGIFILALGFFDAAVNLWIYAGIAILAVLLAAAVARERSPVEKFYERVNLQHNGVYLKRVEKRETETGTEYLFEMPPGLCRSDYEKYREALEQYLDRNVEFSFYNRFLSVTVLKGELLKYRNYEKRT